MTDEIRGPEPDTAHSEKAVEAAYERYHSAPASGKRRIEGAVEAARPHIEAEVRERAVERITYYRCKHCGKFDSRDEHCVKTSEWDWKFGTQFTYWPCEKVECVVVPVAALDHALQEDEDE